MKQLKVTSTQLSTCIWEPIDDLKEFYELNEKIIYDRDICIYIELLIRRVAREFELSYEESSKIIKEMNEPFFKAKQNLISQYRRINLFSDADGMRLTKLFKLFYIPVKDKAGSVSEVIKMFNSLTPVEKLDFLSRIEKLSIKVDKI